MAASLNDPSSFRQMLANFGNRQQSTALSRQHNESLLNADPYDIEAQRRIEEAIRQEAVEESFQNAMEYSPESFGRVIMLYVDGELNGRKIKAFVDSGAQATIMSKKLAEECG
jgi:DNA damage-inducible protein 1